MIARRITLFAVCILAFGTAHAQLILPNGLINAQCVTRPPLPVPPVVVPPQADMPGQASVTVSSAIPTGVELPAQIGGKGTPARIDFNSKGIAIGWWVPMVGRVKLYLHAVTWEYLVANPGLAARLALLAASPTPNSATVAAIGAAYPPTRHILDMCDVWGPLVAPLNASKPAPLPAVTYRVKRNPQAADGSRPVVELKADGTIGRTLSGRAAAGAPCDTSKPTRGSTGADLYATPEGRAAREVSVCEKVP